MQWRNDLKGGARRSGDWRELKKVARPQHCFCVWYRFCLVICMCKNCAVPLHQGVRLFVVIDIDTGESKMFFEIFFFNLINETVVKVASILKFIPNNSRIFIQNNTRIFCLTLHRFLTTFTRINNNITTN